MKTTYTVIIYNKDGQMVNFERFSCKRLQTVLNSMGKLIDDYLYNYCLRTDGADHYKVFDKDNNLVFVAMFG